MYAKIDHTNPQLSITFIILITLYTCNWFVNCFTFKCSSHHDWILIMWNQKLTVWSGVSKGNTRYSIVTQPSYLDNDLHFSIDNGYYFGKTLPMGLSFSCQLFEIKYGSALGMRKQVRIMWETSLSTTWFFGAYPEEFVLETSTK